jgi:uncharacterized flavoprotein (TIGR03862 family)
LANNPANIAIIGGGPAGLIAAERLAGAGLIVTVYERKPSLGRKFLMAGRGGLNLTHSEDFESFMQRYAEAEKFLRPVIQNFSPDDLRTWCKGLEQETFVGSSGRVFPKAMKASPLLRAWTERLTNSGVRFKMRNTWTGQDDRGNIFAMPDGKTEIVKSDATLLALGGASWPGLGSDGSWIDILKQKNVLISPLRPANCGFKVNWSPVFIEKCAGQPLKNIRVSFEDKTISGEAMISQNGIEGGAIYALSSVLRETIANKGDATISIDLRPALSNDALTEKLNAARGRQSFSTWIQKALALSTAGSNLLREVKRDVQNLNPAQLAALIKNIKIKLTAPFPIDRAISTAGGIKLDALDENFMIKAMPGTFAAGEMLDWEAPTGGYLLQASFATGNAAATGILRYISRH